MSVDLTTIFLGIVATIMLSGVPWAYTIHGRLARIEERLHAVVIMSREILTLRECVRDLELRIATSKRKSDP